MFCPRCGTELPEAGDCPSCGQARPTLDAPPTPQVTVPGTDRANAIGCGLGSLAIGVLVGIGVSILICIGYLNEIGNAFGPRFGGK